MGHLKILVFGKAELTSRQRQILSRYLDMLFDERASLNIEYKLGSIDRDELEKIYPADVCPNIVDAVCVDLVVFEYDIPWAIIELLKRGIRVIGFITARTMLGDGDIYDGKIKTVGISEYELSLKKKSVLVY